MTLHDLIAVGGTAMSFALLAVLAALWPHARKDQVICLKTQIDEECTPACQRTCQLKSAA